MKHKKGLVIILLLVLFCMGLMLYYDYSVNSIHSKIDINDVASIYIEGAGKDWVANEDEKREIINWFNSMTDIRINKTLEGVGTPDAEIFIHLKSGVNPIITILQSGHDFDVRKYDENGKEISYWGIQADIRRILKEASQK